MILEMVLTFNPAPQRFFPNFLLLNHFFDLLTKLLFNRNMM